MIRTAMSVVTDVSTVRLKAWLIELFTISWVGNGRLPRFSRIRSRITMVSFNEYPMMVNKPATTPRSMR